MRKRTFDSAGLAILNVLHASAVLLLDERLAAG